MKKFKIIIGIVGLLIPVFILFYFYIKGKQSSQQFYKKKLNYVIIEADDWQKRSVDFYMSDRTLINFTQPIGTKIKLYDSVYKPSGTFIYKVYRKNSNGVYEFFREYNYEDTN